MMCNIFVIYIYIHIFIFFFFNFEIIKGGNHHLFDIYVNYKGNTILLALINVFVIFHIKIFTHVKFNNGSLHRNKGIVI